MSGWHLEYTADVDEKSRLVFEKIFGVWRPETARAYHEDFQREVAPLIKQPWAKLCDLSNWKTVHPDVINIIGQHLKWCRQNNMVWSVNVISNPVTYRHLMKMFQKGGTKGISKTFRTRAEADGFLREKGFKVGSASGGSAAAALFRC
jgi:hypothetical protein